MRRKKKKRDELALTPLTSALTFAMRELSATVKTAHPEIWARWNRIVGKEMYSRSFPLSLRGKLLTVGVSSSPWLHEMSFLEAGIVDRIAEAIGPGVVDKVRFVLDPRVATPTQRPRAQEPAPPTLPVEPRELPSDLRDALSAIEDDAIRTALERAARAFPTDKDG